MRLSSADRRASLALGTLGLLTATVIAMWATEPVFHKVNDFYREGWPSYLALSHGHLLSFLRNGPPYVGSFLLRAPFVMVVTAFGGGARAAYFASALPCVFALVAFCAWLAAQPRRGSEITWASRISPYIWCIVNPVVIVAVLGGHPEEVLGAVLCVTAVVLAVRGHPGWAGFIVGLAVVNKAWALVAVPVVIAVVPAKNWRALLTTGATAGGVLIPILIVRTNGVAAGAAGASGVQIGSIFNPSQLLWWLGQHSWLVRNARPLIILSALICASLWWLVRNRARPSQASVPEALLLLALVLLLRAALDPWSNLYYHVPFLFALMAYEVHSGRMPLRTVLYSVALLAIVPVRGIPHMSFEMRAALYAALVIPTVVWLAARLPQGARRTASPNLDLGLMQRAWTGSTLDLPWPRSASSLSTSHTEV